MCLIVAITCLPNSLVCTLVYIKGLATMASRLLAHAPSDSQPNRKPPSTRIQIGLKPMHDASHFSVTHNATVWKYLGASHDFMNGASYLVWLYQHMLGHHPYTNIDGADPDIVTSEKDVRRIKESQPWYSFYLNQVCVMFALYVCILSSCTLREFYFGY